MATTVLADPKAFAKRLGKSDATLTDKETEALRGASDRFRLEVRHPVHETTTELHLDGDGSHILALPAAPIVDVLKVEINGEPAELGSNITWSTRNGLLQIKNGCFPDGLDTVHVTYTHGYSTTWDTEDEDTKKRLVPDEIQNEIMNLAQYVLERPGVAVQTLTVGGRSISYSAAALVVGVTESWAQAVNAHKLNQGDSA